MKPKEMIILTIAIMMCYILFFYKYNESMKNLKIKNKYVCLYAYYEKNEQYKNNLIFFLKNGGLLENVDYYFILNGPCTVNFPKDKNIKIIQRKNEGFDFGAWSHVVINYLKKSSYSHYIFINSSVEGPHMLTNENTWLNTFLNLFNNDQVKLVGSTINIFDVNLTHIFNFEGPYSHVQSMFFILKKDAFDYLVSINFFDEKKLNDMKQIWEVICNCEILMSQLILKKNWNINCVVPHYKNLDYRTLKYNINPSGKDVLYPNAFFGKTLKPTDVIFYKKYRFE